MRRFLVFETATDTRRVIGQLLIEQLGCTALLYWYADEARIAWANWLPLGAMHGAIVNVDSHDGLDLALYFKGSRPNAQVIMLASDPGACRKALKDIDATIADRGMLASEIVRAVGFAGTLPAGLARKK